jgi:hypothetical protein
MQIKAPQAPVEGFDLKFSWNTEWTGIFDCQRKLIRRDIKRARLDGKFVVYLSCPISARGGGYARTNVEIAKFTERRLLKDWGERFWILNPAQYQLESKEGFGLLDEHARALEKDLSTLDRPTGADYMRMWTQVLVEDGEHVASESKPEPALRNTGRDFAAYYFLGPSDVHAFFGTGTQRSLGSSIEEYFARKHSTDIEFREAFAVKGLIDGAADEKGKGQKAVKADDGKNELRRQWEAARDAFVLFYSLRASANFSLGSHDEWQIFVKLNKARRQVEEKLGGGIPNQIAGFFDGRALGFASSEDPTAAGYSLA